MEPAVSSAQGFDLETKGGEEAMLAIKASAAQLAGALANNLAPAAVLNQENQDLKTAHQEGVKAAGVLGKEMEATGKKNGKGRKWKRPGRRTVRATVIKC